MNSLSPPQDPGNKKKGALQAPFSIKIVDIAGSNVKWYLTKLVGLYYTHRRYAFTIYYCINLSLTFKLIKSSFSLELQSQLSGAARLSKGERKR
jgi:hypothetical protein